MIQFLNYFLKCIHFWLLMLNIKYIFINIYYELTWINYIIVVFQMIKADPMLFGAVDDKDGAFCKASASTSSPYPNF